MKWTAEQRKALRDSVAHWERMREYRKPLPEKYEAPNAKHCACCRKWHSNQNTVIDHRDSCRKCPIPEYSGDRFCFGTPFGKASLTWELWLYGRATRRTWVRAATKEIDFLKKVLEAGK